MLAGWRLCRISLWHVMFLIKLSFSYCAVVNLFMLLLQFSQRGLDGSTTNLYSSLIFLLKVLTCWSAWYMWCTSHHISAFSACWRFFFCHLLLPPIDNLHIVSPNHPYDTPWVFGILIQHTLVTNTYPFNYQYISFSVIYLTYQYLTARKPYFNYWSRICSNFAIG